MRRHIRSAGAVDILKLTPTKQHSTNTANVNAKRSEIATLSRTSPERNFSIVGL